MDAWIEAEARGCRFPDERLGKRFRKVMQILSKGMGNSLPLACQDWAATKAAYRFLDNPRVDENTILAGHFEATRSRFAALEGLTLVLHDTTEFSYHRNHPDMIGKMHKSFVGRTYPSGQLQVVKPGEFSIIKAGYPEGQFGLPRPTGPFRLVGGAEYADALAAKRAINAAINRELPLWRSAGLEWHEITPIKFGGSPTDLANKIPLPAGFHRSQVTPWWNSLQRSIEGAP